MIPCTVQMEKFSGVLHSNLAVVWRIGDSYGHLYALSIAGPSQSIQAVAAGLADHSLSLSWNTRLDNSFQKEETHQRWAKVVSPAASGFELRRAKLAYDTWHLVAVSKDHKFLLHDTEESLWRILRSDKFTTPLLKHWTPVIRQELYRQELLRKLDFFGNCTPAYLAATDVTLDKVVSEGLRRKRLLIQAA